MKNPKSSAFRRERATRALAYIGKDGLPPILEALDDKQSPNRHAAATYLCQMYNLGTNATPAVPRVVALLSDPDAAIAGFAADVLGKWQLEPGIVVPALAKSAQQPKENIFLRNCSIISLGYFKQRARPAVPVLLEAVKDENEVIRSAAVNALRRIAPEVLAYAGGPEKPEVPK
jgi:HEAT repeat protein